MKTIVCHSITDWDAPQIVSRHHIMEGLAQNHRVLFVESPRAPHSLVTDRSKSLIQWKRWMTGGLRRGPGNMMIASPPPVFPFFYTPLSNNLNQPIIREFTRRTLRRLGWSADIYWTYWPNSAAQVGSYGETHAIYHCTDNIIVAKYPLTTTDIIVGMERDLCERVDLMITRTQGMADRLGPHCKRSAVVQGGVDLGAFDPARPMSEPGNLSPIPHPRVGMVGTLDDRLDVDLILGMARALPEVSFVLIGHTRAHLIDTAPLEAAPNVYLLPAVAHTQVPRCVRAFDICLIPFEVNEYTKEVAPIKLYECLAMGKPIVATRLPYIERERDSVSVVDSSTEAIDAVKRMLDQPLDAAQVARQRDAARPWSWDHQIREIEDLLIRLEISA